MGFFDGMAGGLAGGILSYYGQHETNIANSVAADKQMQFQREMDSTKYQRAVQDLQAAGLNPMMAYGNIAAGSPSGALGHAAQSALGSAVEAFNRSRGTEAEIDLKKEQEENAKATTDATKASADKLRQDTKTSAANEVNLVADTSKKFQDARTGSAQEAYYNSMRREADQRTANLQAENASKETKSNLWDIGSDVTSGIKSGWNYLKEDLKRVHSAYEAKVKASKSPAVKTIEIIGNPGVYK